MQKVHPGQIWTPSAAAHNAAVDADNWVRQHQQGLALPRGGAREDYGVIKLRNTSSSDWARYDAIRVQTPPILPSAAEPAWIEHRVYGGSAPAAGIADLGRVAICLEPIARTTGVGRALLCGVIETQLYVIEQWHEYADIDPAAGGRTLVSNPDGSSPCQILWRESGTGLKRAMVRVGNGGQFHVVGVPTGYGISACSGNTPGTGTIRVYYRNPATGQMAAVVGPDGQPCYLDVCNLSDDPIIANSPGATEEYVTAHCDRWGMWWVDTQPHQKVAEAWGSCEFRDSSGNRIVTGVTAITGTVYLGGAGSGWTEANNLRSLDVPFLHTIETHPADHALCYLSLAGDYTLDFVWGGGYGQVINGSPPASMLVGCYLEVNSGGGWQVLRATHPIYRQVQTYGLSYHDGQGQSLHEARRWTAGTRFRARLFVYGSNVKLMEGGGVQAFTAQFLFQKVA